MALSSLHTPPSSDSPLAQGLNPPQAQAVAHHSGPLVVFAGAGSGKTRVITRRIAHLIEEHGVYPGQILAVTFTNKAAGEMRQRVAELVGWERRPYWVGTFHSICARLLRDYADRVGLLQTFVIYDDADARALVSRVMKDLGLDTKRITPKMISGRIGRAKQELQRPGEMPIDSPIDDVAARVYEPYQERLQAAGALDFGGLIARWVWSLEAQPTLRQEVTDRFSHVLVDEFQDTNHAQMRLVLNLAGKKRNLCVVGDDDQSIYRWRGADRRNIIDFRRHFPDATVVKLEQNYRSSARILRAANAVIGQNRDREPKRLWTDREEGPPILVVQCEDERDEATMIARAVQELVGGGRSLEEIVVFYRTHAQSRVLEESLRGRNIPYRVIGGARFYDRAEIKDVLAYLRTLANPQDDVSLLRVINTPARGIGKTTVDRLISYATERGQSIYESLDGDLPDTLFRKAARRKLLDFRDLIRELSAMVPQTPLQELTETLLKRTEYLEVLRTADSAEADARIENVEELVGAMGLFAEQYEDASLHGFLEHTALQTNADESQAAEQLTLMTIHAAKGLEFPLVFVAGLEEDLFPVKSQGMFEDEEEIEEERRLAYVAFTRAQERLLLSYTRIRRIYGQLRPCTPSRFLAELPQEDLQFLGDSPRSHSYRPRSYSRSAPSQSPSWDDDAFAFERASGGSYVDVSDGDYAQEGLYKGMRVRHVKFGAGQVLDVSPDAPPRVRVRFDHAGIKQIVATHLLPD